MPHRCRGFFFGLTNGGFLWYAKSVPKGICKVCGKEFEKETLFQVVCSYECYLKYCHQLLERWKEGMKESEDMRRAWIGKRKRL
ncbi:hypothetical protein DRN34_03180 [Thermococci archaeon]|nr:MAG: hypothetical protein DRN34_03180 [Thermococci archaeon]HDD36639.1 hypothetical protein [Archaeoglobus veneficus]